MSKKQNVWLHLCLFIVGGVGYVLIELLWRRRSHVSMFFVGGLCFELMGMIHTRLRRWSLPARCGLCALAVSAVELVSGCILNRWLRLGVWDYSTMRFHLLGQVSLVYSLLWLLLSAVACPLYGLFRRWMSRLLLARRGAELP